MNNKLITALLISSSILVSCNNETPKTHLVYNDFDSLDGWSSCANPSITKEKAKSGLYSLKIDNTIEYSTGYSNEISKLFGGVLPSKLKIEGSVFKTSEASKGLLVITFFDVAKNESILWESIPFNESIKVGEWSSVSKEIIVPKDLPLNSIFKFYLWRAEPQPDATFIDDISVDVIE